LPVRAVAGGSSSTKRMPTIAVRSALSEGGQPRIIHFNGVNAE
jgi:hypothetical protein